MNVIKYGNDSTDLAICDSRTIGTDIALELSHFSNQDNPNIYKIVTEMAFTRAYYKNEINVNIKSNTYDIMRSIGYLLGLNEDQILSNIGIVYDLVD